MTPSTAQLSAISRLFSSAVFRELAKKGRSGLFARLFNQAGVGVNCARTATVADGFDAAFDVLRTDGLRDEYIYRAALTNKVLLGKHSLNTACMLTEFRAGVCKADLVILNGTATAYEIKSERDSLARIMKQVANYKTVFAKVNVIASESHIDSVMKAVPGDVGVMKLSKRYQITTVREAEDRPDRISPTTVFESLRFEEARDVLTLLGIDVPKVPNTRMHAALRAEFQSLDPTHVHLAMVQTLKRSRDLAPLKDLIDHLPSSLFAAALSIHVPRNEHERLVKAISTPLVEAIAWI